VLRYPASTLRKSKSSDAYALAMKTFEATAPGSPAHHSIGIGFEMGSRGNVGSNPIFSMLPGGGGRTRTYEDVVSGFTVRPLCRSGHSSKQTMIVLYHAGKILPHPSPFQGRAYRKPSTLCQLKMSPSHPHCRLSISKKLASCPVSSIGRLFVTKRKPFRTGSRQRSQGPQEHAGSTLAPRKNSNEPLERLPVVRKRNPRRSRPAAASPELAVLYGFHTVREALASSKRHIVTIYATLPAIERLDPLLAARGLVPNILAADEISARLPKDAVHQGVIALARHLDPVDLSELPATGIVIVLDQITDPHNVGAIIRTAAAFAVDAIVTTERHSPELAGVVAKSASGGLEHVAIVAVTNLARALTQLGEMGYFRIGLDSEADRDLARTPVSTPLALVLGAEGKGLRHLTREKCDLLARLDMAGSIKSLNVSNACAVALTVVSMRLKAQSYRERGC
jgi:23S rRNA (guanosine2251-2'-O)-methyltransferase